jgi:hypothetical protein
VVGKRRRLSAAELAHLATGALGDALAKAVTYAQRSVSPTTEKIYTDDWNAFRSWCLDHRAPYLPAPPAIVAAYLAERATTLGRSGLCLVLAAIAFHHRRAGHLWSSGDPVIATVMRGILGEQKRPVRPAAAITSTEIRLLLSRDTLMAGPSILMWTAHGRQGLFWPRTSKNLRRRSVADRRVWHGLTLNRYVTK